MGKDINNLSREGNDLRAGIDGKGLSNRLAAHCQTCHQSRHQKCYKLRHGKGEVLQHLRRNGSGSRAGNNTANISNHIVTNGADTFGIAQKVDRLYTSGHLACCHGMKGFFIRGSDCDTDHIKQNTDQNNGKQDQKSDQNGAVCHDLIGYKGNRTGNQNCNEKNSNDPSDRFITFFSL